MTKNGEKMTREEARRYVKECLELIKNHGQQEETKG